MRSRGQLGVHEELTLNQLGDQLAPQARVQAQACRQHQERNGDEDDGMAQNARQQPVVGTGQALEDRLEKA